MNDKAASGVCLICCKSLNEHDLYSMFNITRMSLDIQVILKYRHPANYFNKCDIVMFFLRELLAGKIFNSPKYY